MAQVPIIEYFKPLRPVITIRDKNNDPTYVYHDSFHPPEPSSGSPSIYYCDVDLAYGQAGTFTLKINDPERQLDSSKIGLGNKVWIQAGRDEFNLFNLFSGVCRSCKPIRQNYNLLGYELSGFGTQIIMNERVVNFLRTSLRDPANPNKPFVLDPNMAANKLFNVLMTANDIIPLFFPALKHTLHAGMFDTTSKIEANVDTFIASLTEPYVEASQVANSIADMCGAIWGVEPQAPGEPDKVFLRFPSTFHSGTIIKDRPESPEEYTNKNIAYLRAATGGFSFVDSMRKEDGFTNRIFSKTGADIASGSTSSVADNFTALAGFDIAQQFTANSTRFRDLAFTVGAEGIGEQVGDGTGLYTPTIHRFSIVDDAGGRPGSNVQFQSTFPREVNNGEVKTVFIKIPTNFTFPTISPGQKAWVIMHQNCGVTWPSNADEDACGTAHADNSLHWHHDGGNVGVSAIRTVCTMRGARRSPPHEDTTSGWVINNAGPTYTHSFFDSFSHIIEASDQQSIDKYGEVDSFIDASFLTDENSMNQYLSSILQYAAKPRRIYEFAEVFIPYQSPIEPGSLVTIIDSISGHTPQRQLTAEVQEVRYEFAADASGTNPLGAHTCEVRLLGYVDYREQSVIAVSEQSLEVPIPPPGSGNPPPPPPPPPPPGPDPGVFTDTDGVKIIYPLNNAQGKFHHNLFERVGSSTSFDGDDILEMDIEGNATKTTAGGVTYWRCISREGSFASGGTNWTSRPEWVSNHCNTPAGVSGAKSRGYLCNANDPKSVECTIIFKVIGIHDNSEEATMGIRGDDHGDQNEKCLEMKNFYPYGQHTSNLWGFEKTHPDVTRRAVTFVSPYNSSNHPLVGSNIWRGMKLIAWNINNNQGLHCEMWIDESPINPSGGYNNNWKKVWIYEEQRSDTPTWGGPRQQFRVDMCDELHLAAFSCHEIIPPSTGSQIATATELTERAEYEQRTGLTYPDYIAELVPSSTEIQTETTITDINSELSPANIPESILDGEIQGIGTEGQTLIPKIIPKEPEPIVAERDEVDATFGE